MNPLAAGGGTNLTLETVAAIGQKFSPAHPDWVSYLVRSNGKWVHSTDYTVPANSVVHVTLYQFDSPTGLRNPFLSQVQGTIGGTMTVDGKTVNSINPEEASHTFAVPELGVFVPLPGVPEEAKNPCEEAPCEPSTSDHHTITFSFRTGKKGRYRWQCFVPCGAGFSDRQRRADADARLHGRLHRCGLAVAMSEAEPRAPLRDHLGRRDGDRHAAGDRR